MSIVDINRIISHINGSIERITIHNTLCEYYPDEIAINENDDMAVITRNIARELNAIEESYEDECIILKRNDINIKIRWYAYYDDNVADIAVDTCKSSNAVI
jgi:hypothetical protein